MTRQDKINEYAVFLEELCLPNFSPSEFTSLLDNVRDGVQNSAPDSSLWENIVRTIWVVQLLRDRVGPIQLLSVYRSPEYNEAVGGASDSYHMKHNAIDFSCGDLNAAFYYLNEWRDAGVFEGGIKKYNSGFIHADTRGRNANW